MKKKKSWREKLGILLIITGTIIFIFYIVGLIYSGYLNTTFLIDTETSANIGSFIGGVAGSMWAIGGILFLYETLNFQRNEFEETNKNNIFNQKEVTFFRFLKQLNVLISFLSGELTVEGHKQTYTGRSYLHNVYELFRINHSTKVGSAKMNWGIRESVKKIRERKEDNVSMNFDDIDLNDIKRTIINTYESFYEEYHYNLGHYFRFVYNIVKYIIDNFKEEEDRLKYAGILQAQLSNDELGLLFFNCLSKYGLNSRKKLQFHEWVDKYQLLQNIDEQSIFDAKYVDFYPNTKFRFIEIKNNNLNL